jgi:hypothetical protein
MSTYISDILSQKYVYVFRVQFSKVLNMVCGLLAAGRGWGIPCALRAPVKRSSNAALKGDLIRCLLP